MFEYASMVGDLLGFDVVSTPTFDWGMAAGYSMRMAARITGRNQVLVTKTISPDRYLCIQNLVKPNLELQFVDYDQQTGLLNLEDLKAKISANTAAVYFENPSYLGSIETQAEDIAAIAHNNGALCLVGADPSSLGVLSPPSSYGADIACGDLQPLGIHMNAGGGLAGFIASRDEEKYGAVVHQEGIFDQRIVVPFHDATCKRRAHRLSLAHHAAARDVDRCIDAVECVWNQQQGFSDLHAHQFGPIDLQGTELMRTRPLPVFRVARATAVFLFPLVLMILPFYHP